MKLKNRNRALEFESREPEKIKETRTLGQIEAEIEKAAAELKVLTDERDAMPEEIEDATERLDAERLEQLHKRNRFLSVHIDMARVKLFKLHVARAVVQIPAAEAAQKVAKERWEKTYAAFLKAKDEADRADYDHDRARGQVSSFRAQIIDSQKRIREILHRIPERLHGTL
jgi:uncharacterized protein YbaP (TraB family)